ncbi:uncharacterized protein LOC119553549 isoform X2 [Drosophila subpulchrella]|nr:uncharacterized protein LOC119553549 isoform X2 [Drosophila subpulchrella]
MAFLPGSTTLQRTRSSTYAPDETEAAQDQDQYEELELKFSDQPDFLDSKLMGSDGGDSIPGEVENGLNNDLVDNELSDSLHTYEENWPSKRKRFDPPSSPSPSPTPATKMCDMLSKFLQSENKAAPRRPIFGYWESLLDKMPPEFADVVEQKMTKVLWAEQDAFKSQEQQR